MPPAPGAQHCCQEYLSVEHSAIQTAERGQCLEFRTDVFSRERCFLLYYPPCFIPSRLASISTCPANHAPAETLLCTRELEIAWCPHK